MPIPTRTSEPSPQPRRGERGFTVAELAVALVVIVEVILGVLLLFDFSNKLARVQTNVTEMQQSLRIAQYDMVRLVRMTGRGGLPMGTLPADPANLVGIALGVRNNAPSNSVIGAPGSPPVLAGTDVLTIRGVLTGSLYQAQRGAAAALALNNANPLAATAGSFTITNQVPLDATANASATMTQDLSPLVAAIKANIPEALVLQSLPDPVTYAVVELDPGNSDATNPNSVKVAFIITGDALSAGYKPLSSGALFNTPAGVSVTIRSVGVLEEYRFYVREEHAVAADPTSDLTSKLSRARFFPGSNTAYQNDPLNLSVDVADNVTDLQVALGFDSPLGGGSMWDGSATTMVEDGTANDDWLFNAKADTPINIANWNGSPLLFVRLNTLVRTDRRDPQYLAPQIVKIEDRDYTGSPFNAGTNLMFRRRLLQTVVDLRNVP
jgi:hypothetical protein